VNASSDLTAVIAFNDGNVVLTLQIHPELWPVSEIPSEPNRGVGAYRPASVQYVGDTAGWYADRKRQAVGAQRARGELALQETAGMSNGRHGIHPLW
jgi:hypothetical protein